MADIPERDRPRERLIKMGAKALSTRDLIAAIIGRGIRGRGVLAVSSDVERLFDQQKEEVSIEDLAAIPGMGRAKACQLVAALELARRVRDRNEGIRITSPEQVLRLPDVEGIRNRHQEHFLAITLNGAGEVIQVRILTIGLLNASQVHPREAFADAITDRAAAVVFVHNHPSGSLEPSGPDLAVTRQLVEAGDLLGIQVLDHLIVSKKGHRSLKAAGAV
jgi:DNA repair protein RadC